MSEVIQIVELLERAGKIVRILFNETKMKCMAMGTWKRRRYLQVKQLKEVKSKAGKQFSLSELSITEDGSTKKEMIEILLKGEYSIRFFETCILTS